MVNAAAKLMSRTVSQRVQKGMDVTVGNVTLPRMRHPSKSFSSMVQQQCMVLVFVEEALTSFVERITR